MCMYTIFYSPPHSLPLTSTVSSFSLVPAVFVSWVPFTLGPLPFPGSGSDHKRWVHCTAALRPREWNTLVEQ